MSPEGRVAPRADEPAVTLTTPFRDEDNQCAGMVAQIEATIPQFPNSSLAFTAPEAGHRNLRPAGRSPASAPAARERRFRQVACRATTRSAAKDNAHPLSDRSPAHVARPRGRPPAHRRPPQAGPAHPLAHPRRARSPAPRRLAARSTGARTIPPQGTREGAAKAAPARMADSCEQNGARPRASIVLHQNSGLTTGNMKLTPTSACCGADAFAWWQNMHVNPPLALALPLP